MRLNAKTAIITAAASGMGRAGCELFAGEGAHIVAIDVNGAALEELVGNLRQNGASAFGITADLLDAAACRDCIEQAAAELGGLDILWNHAGIPGQQDIEQLDLDAYARTMDLNLRSGLIASMAAVPHMRQRGGGSLIFTSSMAGLVASNTSPIYSAAKFAVVGLAKSLAIRYAADKIRVNAICPGPVDTPMLPQFFGGSGDPDAVRATIERINAAVPLGRSATPMDVAYGALYLASDESSFVTGIALPIDGGFTAR